MSVNIGPTGWLLLLCIFGARPAAGCHPAEDCGFLAREIRTTGTVKSITIGDFNRDSVSDIAVRTSEDLSVLLGTASGNFSTAFKTAVRYGPAPDGIAEHNAAASELAADFNCDGKLDLALKDRGEILFGVGDGTFLPPETIRGSVPNFYGLSATGDFNGDKRPDLLFLVRGSLATILANGDGTFRLGTAVELGGDGQLLVADFNRDGHSDLAYFRYRYLSRFYDLNCCDLRVFLGQRDGAFEESAQFSGIPPGGILVADFNVDGSADIATPSEVLLGKGDGRFERGGNFVEDDGWYQTPAGPAAAADLDGDTRVDLVHFSTTEGRTIAALRGRGDGTFEPFSPSTLWLRLWQSENWRVGGIADFDGDGRPDVVMAIFSGDNQTSPHTPPGVTGTVLVLLNRIEPQLRDTAVSASGILARQ